MSGPTDVDLVTVLGPTGALLTTPDQWVASGEEVVELVTAELEAAVARANRRIDEIDTSTLEKLGLLVPVLGLVTHGSTDDAKADLRRKLQEAVDTITTGLTELWTALRTAMQELAGDPIGLLDLGGTYLAAKVQLDGAQRVVREQAARLGYFWGGQGWEAFGVVQRTQAAAFGDAAGLLDRAQERLAEAAQAIKNAWSRLMSTLLDFIADCIRVFGDCFDAGNIITFEVGPALSLVATTLDVVNGATSAVRDLDVYARSAGVAAWDRLNGSSSTLPDGGSWPTVDPLDQSLLTSPGRWTL